MKTTTAPVEWIVDNLQSIGGLPVTVHGQPQIIATELGPAVHFDGVSAALFLEANPLAGAATFTLEAQFRPDPGGAPEQRFVHIQETGTVNRLLLEMRLTSTAWYADTYIRSGDTHAPLSDPQLLHPFGQWHTMALVYDGTHMIQYVDGHRELSLAVRFQPLGNAQISIGCRINRVDWFKGAVRAVRFTPAAVTSFP